MKSVALLVVACSFGLALSTASLFAGDDPPAPAKPAGDSAKEKPKEKDKGKTEKPIKSLKELMERMQKENSDVLLAWRASDAAAVLQGVKKVGGYIAQIEKWIPDKVSKDEAKKKRFLGHVSDLKKGQEATLKLLEASDNSKASPEYAKALENCKTCHDEFRPKK